MIPLYTIDESSDEDDKHDSDDESYASDAAKIQMEEDDKNDDVDTDPDFPILPRWREKYCWLFVIKGTGYFCKCCVYLGHREYGTESAKFQNQTKATDFFKSHDTSAKHKALILLLYK